jgi:hypothetical protein
MSKEEKFYWCDENGLRLVEDVLRLLEEGIEGREQYHLTYLAALKSIDKLTWFLGNEIREMEELTNLPKEENKYAKA